MIPVLQPSVSEAEVEAVAAVLRSRWWGNGPRCAEFERRFAAQAGRAYCVTTNSATAALHLSLLALGVSSGDEVILPALTFVSTALAVRYCGAVPVFVDVLPETLTVNWLEAKQAITARTRVLLPVDFAGYPAAEGPPGGNGWHYPVVQDAAHGDGRVSYGTLACHSFHPVKCLATGDGGAIVLDDDEMADRLRVLRWCGISRNTWQRSGERYSWDYDIAELGYKYHWNDLQAAIGLAQLERLDAMQQRRRGIAERYLAELGGVCQLPAWHREHAWHLFVIRVEAAQRQPLIAALAHEGIAAGVHYRPVTEFEPFRQPTPPVTAREWQRCVSLPIFPDLTDEAQGRVIATVKRALRRAA